MYARAILDFDFLKNVVEIYKLYQTNFHLYMKKKENIGSEFYDWYL